MVYSVYIVWSYDVNSHNFNKHFLDQRSCYQHSPSKLPLVRDCEYTLHHQASNEQRPRLPDRSRGKFVQATIINSERSQTSAHPRRVLHSERSVVLLDAPGQQKDNYGKRSTESSIENANSGALQRASGVLRAGEAERAEIVGRRKRRRK